MLIYEVLTGQPPWPSRRNIDVVVQVHLGAFPPRPNTHDFDDEIWRICTSCWKADPVRRPEISQILGMLHGATEPVKTIKSTFEMDIDGKPATVMIPDNERQFRGGMSTVKKGYTVIDGEVKWYAVKICDQRLEAIIRREFRVWKSLSHENILPLSGFLVREGPLLAMKTYVFVSPFMQRGTLAEYIQDNQQADRLGLMIGVAEGLKYLHNDEKLVHGDIKASNILITDGRQAQLADFGLSTTVAPGSQPTEEAIRERYTPAYMAPELFVDDAYNSSAPDLKRSKTKMSDIYAFGVLLYYTYAGGILPRRRGDYITRLDIGDSPTRPTGGVAIFCDTIWLLCRRCWANDPFERPNVQEIHHELIQLKSFPEKQAQVTAS
ncbi:kinase-like protein [Auricularia subglabra TFB-10046 SS5]|nr:kinase-like protein [Auricularia subglabra TFB-10046 SS5]